MDNQEKTLSQSPDPQAIPPTPLDAKGLARRRFARAGAGATGAILTLHSQAGMVTFSKTMCKSPSGYMSMKPGASAKPDMSCNNNRSHGYWKTHPEEWKTAAGMAPGAKFKSFFVCSGNYAGLADATMMQVIDPSEAIKAIDRNNVALQCVAALLNARAARYAGLPSVLPEDRVVDIWTQFATLGYYAPSKGATPWTGDDIATYLDSTFR